MIEQDVDLKGSLRKYFGFDQFKGNQEEIIESILAGRDTFVIKPTGGGKSLCYQLPAVISEGTAIVISPLIALMKNQVDLMRGYSSNDNIAHFLNSQLSKAQITQVREDITEGRTKILYVAPESLVKQENIDFLSSVKISFVAVDEAHCISEWGHDFRPEYRRIRMMINAIGDNVPIMALTATATPKVQTDIQKTLKMEEPKVFISSFLRENLYYEVRPKMGKKQTVEDIIRFIRKRGSGQCGIIYCLSRKTTEELAAELRVNGILAEAYHAGLDAGTRTQRQDEFLMEDIQVIVATIAFGMGIDKPDVRFVIHFDIPKSLENYYQETGRAGRDGLEGTCVAYFSHQDINKLEKFMKDKPVAEKEIGGQHLTEVVAYAETGECRKRFVLHYFGENTANESCGGMCDNCNHPREFMEGRDYMVQAIDAVRQLNEKCSLPYTTNVITGKLKPEIKSFRHDQLPIFGAGKEHDANFWNSVLRKAILSDYLRKDIEEYGILKITEKGQSYLENPQPVSLVLNHAFPQSVPAGSSGHGSGNGKQHGTVDEDLLNRLRDLRRQIARKKNLPTYVIFNDASLEDMASQFPVSLDEMPNITGVSQGKANRYGAEFAALISEYVEENDIDRPVDFVVKSVVNKSSQKVAIIKAIDSKVPLDELASDRGMDMEELLQEMYSIVSSGTRLNINYYIDDVVDEDVQEIIYDYFMEAESDSLEDAMAALADEDVEMEELQLVRIKFLTEVAN